ncbi:3-isopropylmalate dehydratase small subunit [Nitrospirillum sp. BR 11163]|uniref:3-isopropylmalate dehydratase small subunit n=1 Tax=Nitrospirillum sp. BR 11163 TaxID=3104323 RepID=UPI002AFF158A|nr:3-isopropylmalate dehydratase small subunit [Nitrospirillum sp. BR 11163]MEA1674196.1 3-isopropylmalate dehydratase small subunit [Nitrospirillum sp. BR 11163]
MQPFTRVTGPAAPLPQPNVDTDVIMPKQFLKGVDRKGLDRGVFYDLRFGADGQPRPDFILNRPGWQGARFLVVGPNFGCGSSREHAVWGLAQLGIRALIGTSFAGIFNDNCQRNGILTVTLPVDIVDDLMARISRPDANGLTIDLPGQVITVDADGRTIPFAIDALRRDALVQGLDGVSATLARHAAAIRAFEVGHRQASPWFY